MHFYSVHIVLCVCVCVFVFACLFVYVTIQSIVLAEYVRICSVAT